MFHGTLLKVLKIYLNDKWNIFKTMFNAICQNHAPVKTQRVKGKDIPWLTVEIRQMTIEMMFKRDTGMSKKLAKKSKLISHWDNYRTLRNNVTKLLRLSRKQYYDDLIASNINNPSNMWNAIKKVMPCKPKTSPNAQGDSNEKHMSNCFNAFFTSVGKKLASIFINKHVPDKRDDREPSKVPTVKPRETKFKFRYLTLPDVFDHLVKLKVAKATGLDAILDGLSSNLLKHAAPAISQPLIHIFNFSLDIGQVPDD